MRTVRWLRDELAKFPDNAVCFAYEGEITGIVIEHAGRRLKEQGEIHCSEYDDSEKETRLLQEATCDHNWAISQEAFMVGDPLHPAICTRCGMQTKLRRSLLPTKPDQHAFIAALDRFGHDTTGIPEPPK
jgi:hypothetical protein